MLTMDGLPPPLWNTFTVAGRRPTSVGLNATLTVQVPSGLMVPVHVFEIMT